MEPDGNAGATIRPPDGSPEGRCPFLAERRWIGKSSASRSLESYMAAAFTISGPAHAASLSWLGAVPAGCVNWTNRLDQDASLVERCLSGDEAAWEDLVRVNSRKVYSVCYRFTGRDQEAQDLTQDVFMRVFKTLRSFRSGEGSFSVWLMRLTRNLLIDNYRRGKQDRTTDSIEDQLPMLEEKVGITARADGLLAGREASEILQAALGKLSPELRETLILRDLEEMEYREIADALGVPEGTVKSRLNRGRAELARILRKHKVAV